MIEIRIHGRGGQGNVKAAEFLAMAAFYQGKFAQAFPVFGVERKGAPVTSFVRIGDSFIRLREQVYAPDYIIIQDSSLIKNIDVFEGASAKTKVIINSEKAPKDICPGRKGVYCVPATDIALKVIGKPIINTTMIGAFAKISGLMGVEALKQAITVNLSEKYGGEIITKNIKALETAYESI